MDLVDFNLQPHRIPAAVFLLVLAFVVGAFIGSSALIFWGMLIPTLWLIAIFLRWMATPPEGIP